MKRVLIVGADSYIGCSFENYAQGRLDVYTVDARDDEWRKMDCSSFGSVLYVAGIAHRKQTKVNKELYFAVNRDLAVSVAQKAKEQGVKQFIYLSSMAVYGVKTGEITERTVLAPPQSDYYGLSKYQAEELLAPMQTQHFRVVLVRPPMVYGPGCKGKFQQLIKIAQIAPLIPVIENKRSMIFIDNLCELLTITAELGISGILCPQNEDYVCTSAMLAELSKTLGRKALSMPGFLVRMLLPFSKSLQSAFGSLYYSPQVYKMPFDQNYQKAGFIESIKKAL